MDYSIYLFVFWFFFLIFMLIRNNWVHTKRIQYLKKSYNYARYCIYNDIKFSSSDCLSNLGKYDTTIFKFWVWDVRYFAKDKDLYDRIQNFSKE